VGDFERDTRLEGGDGRYSAELSRDWEIWGPNGGYVAAIALRAAGRESRIPRPASFAGHFLGVARFDAVDLTVTPVRRGRSTESLRVSVRQGDRPVLEAIVRTAAEAPGLEHDAGGAPDTPAPETLRSADELRKPEWGTPYPFWQNLDARPVSPERFDEGPRARPPIWRE
jgi:acyl-CoA thioesterase